MSADVLAIAGAFSAFLVLGRLAGSLWDYLWAYVE